MAGTALTEPSPHSFLVFVDYKLEGSYQPSIRIRLLQLGLWEFHVPLSNDLIENIQVRKICIRLSSITEEFPKCHTQ